MLQKDWLLVPSMTVESHGESGLLRVVNPKRLDSSMARCISEVVPSSASL